jgi:membrane protein implicated in regulation of membrane protease activity
MDHWWMWIVLGVALAAIELLTPGGLFIIFFGVAAVIVGGLSLVGVVERAWVEWLLFSVLAIVALRLFRAPLLARLQKAGGGKDVDSLVGETAVAADTMAPGEHGHVELRGSRWTSQNVGSRAIGVAERCRVVAVDGLRLDVAAP